MSRHRKYIDYSLLQKVEDADIENVQSKLIKMLSDARKATGLSQRELAYKCGATQSEISRLENGKRSSFNLVLSVAAALQSQLLLVPEEKVKTVQAAVSGGKK